MRADAILSGDYHLTHIPPRCRVDSDFMKTQRDKLRFLRDLQKDNDCPILFSGDLFDRWNVPPFLISFALQHLPDRMIAVPGNHDLPAHNLGRLEESPFKTMELAERIRYLKYQETFSYSLYENIEVFGFPYGEKLYSVKRDRAGMKIALVHYYVYKGKKPFPGQMTRVTSLMDQLKGFDLIVTGDNHLPFIHQRGYQVLVNPGSLLRIKGDQINHRPRVYLWNASTNHVKPIYLPIKKGNVTREHLDREHVRDERIESFISKLNEQKDISLSFVNNMKKFIRANHIRGNTEKKIWEAING